LLDNFWPILTLTCSIRWKTLSSKRHCARFAGTHRYACSQICRAGYTSTTANT